MEVNGFDLRSPRYREELLNSSELIPQGKKTSLTLLVSTASSEALESSLQAARPAWCTSTKTAATGAEMTVGPLTHSWTSSDSNYTWRTMDASACH